MKVKNLIEKLQEYDEDMEICYRLDYPEQEYLTPYLYVNGENKLIIAGCREAKAELKPNVGLNVNAEERLKQAFKEMKEMRTMPHLNGVEI